MLLDYFKSVLQQDTSPVVICDTEHKIIYMNPAACRRYGDLHGRDLQKCHNPRSVEMIYKVLAWFRVSSDNNKVHTFYNEKENKDVYMIALRDAQGELIGYYEKHEYRDRDMSPLYGMNGDNH